VKHTLVVLAGLVLLRIFDPWPVETLRLKYFDSLFNLNDSKPSQYVAIFDIDEAALEKHGQWPWPRQELAALNRQLQKQGASAVVYTVLFPEEDRFGGDGAFAESMEFVPTFLSAVAIQQDRTDGWHIGVSTIGPVMENAITYAGILPNVEVLQNAAVGTGIVNSAPEVDGLVRRVPMLVRVGDALYPALGLDVLRGLAGDPSYQAKAGEAGIQAVRVPKFDTIQTDNIGRVWIDWNTTFSDDMDGRIVFVGVTAAGISPMVPTPVGQMHPHRIQAALFETLIQGTSPIRPDWALFAEILTILIFGGAVIALTRFSGVSWVSVLVIGSGALAAAASVYAYVRLGALIDAAFPVVTILATGATGVAQRMIVEYRLKLQIRGQFGTYVSPDLVKQLENDPTLLKLGGETKTMTFLFCDIVGFTPISEKLQEDPQKLVGLINRLLTQLTDCVLKHGGTVDKFMGDCIMAFWGAPLDCEDHAQRAMLTAKDMLGLLDELNAQLDAEGLPNLHVGVGINTGQCVVGNMGSEARFDYSVLGDAVNTSSRLEGQTRNYDEWILIGENTAKYQPDWVRYVDAISVKGKSEPLQVYTLKDEAIDVAN
jgi:adenylate cyclase